MAFFQSLGAGLGARCGASKVCDHFGIEGSTKQWICSITQLAVGTTVGILTADPHGAVANATKTICTHTLVHQTGAFATLHAASHGASQIVGMGAAHLTSEVVNQGVGQVLGHATDNTLFGGAGYGECGDCLCPAGQYTGGGDQDCNNCEHYYTRHH